jgi:hypothetical protein
MLSFTYFLLFMLLVYSFAVLFSMIAVYAKEASFKRYNTFKDLPKLVAAAFLKPILFHPFTVYAALRGNWKSCAEIRAGAQ